jgi:membrane-associated phospholipid phosphatase
MLPSCKHPDYMPLLWAGILLLCLNGTVYADDTHPPSYPEILAGDVKHVLTAPERWQQQEWRDMGLAAAGLVVVAAILDRPVRDEMHRHAPNNNRFLLTVERFGAEYSLGMLGGFYLAGALGNNDKAAAVAQDGLSACIIASGIVTPAIKFATGRARPRENVGVAHFRPFNGSYALNSSFPSGHPTQAFALASVISGHYDDAWVKYSSYTVAGLVGVARSYHDAHFASDVLAGALVGTLVGQSVVEYNRTVRSVKVVLLPEITPELKGVRLIGSF